MSLTMIYPSDGRVYGEICPLHPELNGLRNRPYKSTRKLADERIVVRVRDGGCVGCRSERNRSDAERRKGGKVSDGITFLAIILGVNKIPNGKRVVLHRMRG